ncbi:MAG: Gfo/Idh/MocA family oxidoreductase [Kiritimatiellae bacterium]|nr:Gfo/Idh/MocA family oxidoreductase [Kiritimatiellia bacterium]
MSKGLRVGIVGGSADSFMGSIHRAAIEACGCIELVCGAFGSTRQSSFTSGKALELPTRRVYGTYRDMFRREASLPKDERMDFVAVLAPNAMHYPVAMSSIDAGFSIFCEKPYTCNMDEALNLTRKLRNSGLDYGIAMVYKSYPMLRKAKELLQEGSIVGNIRKVSACLQLGWMAQRLETAGNKQAGWRADPRRCGPAGCLADLGTHCFHLAEWLSDLTVTEICADLRPTVAGRILDDDCSVLARFNNGARATFLTSQVATGRADGIAIEIFGDKGSLEWAQNAPERLIASGLDGKQTIYTGGTPEGRSENANPEPYGRNAAYIAALADAYAAFAKVLTDRKTARRENIAEKSFMTVDEGLRTVAFVDAVLKNTTAPEEGQPPPQKWMPVIVPPIPEL